MSEEEKGQPELPMAMPVEGGGTVPPLAIIIEEAGEGAGNAPVARPSMAVLWPLPARATSPTWGDFLIVVCGSISADVMVGVFIAVVALTFGAKDQISNVLPYGVIAGNVVGVGLAWYFACRKYRRTLDEGLAAGVPPLVWMALAVAVAVAWACVAVTLVTRTGGSSLFLDKTVSEAGKHAWIVAMLFVAFTEEIYYRGFLYGALRDKLNTRAAIVIITLWFAGAHWTQFVSEPITLPILLALSLFLTLIRAASKSVFPSMAAHLVYNGLLIWVYGGA